MIPIGLYSYDFVLILMAYLAVTLVWICWALRLAFAKNRRWHLRAWRGPLFVLFAGVAVYSLWSVYAFNRHMDAYAEEQRLTYHPVLEAAQRLGAIEMPAGTQLALALPHNKEAFYQAEFPHPVKVSGVAALRAERYLAMHTDAQYRTAGFTPQTLRLTGQGESRQEGWICDAAAVIVFDTAPDGRATGFQSCFAASGNLIDGQPLPNSSEILASEGRLYLDGRRGLDRWLIHLPPEAEFTHEDVAHKGGAVLLDADRRVIERIVP